MGSQPSVRFLWTPVVGYMAFIFALSSISRTPAFDHGSDKALHTLLYGGLGALLTRALTGGWRQPVTFAAVAGTVLIAVAYGASDELHQSFVPLRSSSALDVVADGVGAAVAALALYLWGIIRGRHDL